MPSRGAYMTSAPHPRSESLNGAPGERLPAAQQLLAGKGGQRRGSQAAALLSQQVRRLPEEAARPTPRRRAAASTPASPPAPDGRARLPLAPLRCPRRPGPQQPLCPETLELRTPHSRRLSAGRGDKGGGGGPRQAGDRAQIHPAGAHPRRPAAHPRQLPSRRSGAELTGAGRRWGRAQRLLSPSSRRALHLPAGRSPAPRPRHRGWGPRGARRRGTARRAGRAAPGAGGRCGQRASLRRGPAQPRCAPGPGSERGRRGEARNGREAGAGCQRVSGSWSGGERGAEGRIQERDSGDELPRGAERGCPPARSGPLSPGLAAGTCGPLPAPQPATLPRSLSR